MKFEFSRQILEKYSNIDFLENPSSGSQAVPCERKEGQTDGRTNMTKLIVAICNFAKAHYGKYSNIDFIEKPSSGSQAVPCKRKEGQIDGRTNMTKLIVVLCNFAKAS
jgi:hypothetical protein